MSLAALCVGGWLAGYKPSLARYKNSCSPIIRFAPTAYEFASIIFPNAAIDRHSVFIEDKSRFLERKRFKNSHRRFDVNRNPSVALTCLFKLNLV